MTKSLAVIEQKPWYRQDWPINVTLSLMVFGPVLMVIISRFTDWKGSTIVLVGFAPALFLDVVLLVMMTCDTRWHRYRSRIVRVTLDPNARVSATDRSVVDKAILKLENGDSLRVTNIDLQTLGSHRYIDYEHRVSWLLKIDNRNITFHSSL